MQRLRSFGIPICLLVLAISIMVHYKINDLFAFVSQSDPASWSMITSSSSFSEDSTLSPTIGLMDMKIDMCKVFHQVDLSSDSLQGKKNLKEIPIRMQKNLVPFMDNLCQEAFDLYYADASSTSALEGFRHRARPIVLGTEGCESMRIKYGPKLRIAIAGMFNTGTNAIARNLQANIGIPGHENDTDTPSSELSMYAHEVNRNGVDDEVPWWKHHPDILNTSFPLHRDPSIHSHILPIVMVRDPLNWMRSTCISRYDLSWPATPPSERSVGHRQLNRKVHKKTCPKTGFLDRKTNQTIITPVYFNLRETLNGTDIDHRRTIMRRGKITKIFRRRRRMLHFESILHVWNQFYQQYLTADFPRLMVRFEDSMYLFPQVLDEIQQCVYGYSKSNITEQYFRKAKSHGSRSNLWSALRKNSDTNLRLQSLSSLSEKQYARSVLDSKLMEVFHYKMP
jgi:hypothetical protein